MRGGGEERERGSGRGDGVRRGVRVRRGERREGGGVRGSEGGEKVISRFHLQLLN